MTVAQFTFTALKALCFNVTTFPADATLTTIIAGLVAWAEVETGVTVESTDELPAGWDFFVRDAFLWMRSNKGASGESLDEYSYSLPEAFPPAILRWLKPTKKGYKFI